MVAVWSWASATPPANVAAARIIAAFMGCLRCGEGLSSPRRVDRCQAATVPLYGPAPGAALLDGTGAAGRTQEYALCGSLPNSSTILARSARWNGFVRNG